MINAGVDEALALLPANMDSLEARVEMAAIGLQESRFVHRRQIRGPARGFWQFERGGGVHGVLNHRASNMHAITLCHARGVKPATQDVYQRLEHDDVLAAGFARLLLWTDPRPLPAVGEVAQAWEYYLRTWRPGKPHRQTWDALYVQAIEFVRGGPKLRSECGQEVK